MVKFNRFGNLTRENSGIKTNVEIGNVVEKDGILYLINGCGSYDYQMWGDSANLCGSNYIMTENLSIIKDKKRIETFMREYIKNMRESIRIMESIKLEDKEAKEQMRNIKEHVSYYESNEKENN